MYEPLSYRDTPARSTRRERLERRAEKRHEWAESRAAKADAAYERVHAIADGIPFGQPILVGHHSEGRARRDQARIESGMRASVNNSRAAVAHEEKARGIEAQLARSIFDDDADAVERLEARLAELEAKRTEYKAQGRGVLPAYVLRNLGAEIRRNRERLEQVKRQKAAEAAGVRVGGRVMVSRFSSSCAECGSEIEKGSPITYFRSTREAVHVECPGRDA